MWFGSFGVLTLLLTTTVNCAKDDVNRLGALQQRFAQGGHVIDMSAADYSKFFSPNRDYSMVTLFTTTNPQHGCGLCPQVQEEFNLMAASYAAAGHPQDLFFVTLDYARASNVFAMLQLTKVPVISFMKPDAPPGLGDDFNIHRSGSQAEAMAKFVSDRAHIKLFVKRPIDFVGLATKVGAVLLFLRVITLIITPAVLAHYANQLMCCFTIVFILLMTAGQKWNDIRNAVPYLQSEKGMSIFYPNIGSQTQLETYSVMAIHTVGALAMVGLILQGSNLRTWVCLVLLLVAYSTELYVFRFYKNHGYPLRLLF